MPRLKKHKIKLLGVDIELPIIVKTNGLFTVNLPEEIHKRISQVEEKFNTLGECITAIDRYVEEVNTMETKVEWILAYQIKTRVKKNTHDSLGKLEILYTPLKKTTKGEEVIYNWISYDTFGQYADPDCPVPKMCVLGNTMGQSHHQTDMVHPESHKAKVIPLTVENLTFFQGLCDELGKLNDRLNDFLKDSDDLQVKILESKGIKLLSE